MSTVLELHTGTEDEDSHGAASHPGHARRRFEAEHIHMAWLVSSGMSQDRHEHLELRLVGQTRSQRFFCSKRFQTALNCKRLGKLQTFPNCCKHEAISSQSKRTIQAYS